MCPRPYRLGRREVTVDETRERVLSAATEVFADSGFFRATLDDVAAKAGVARATVYYQFKSKFGLLEATIAHVLESSPGVESMRKAREHPDAVEGLRLYMQEVCKFWVHDFVFFRNVIGLAAIDPDAAKATDQYDLRRRELLVWTVKRLEDQGRLRDGISQRQALDTIWLLTSFRSFDHLYARSGLSVKRCAALLTGLAQSVVSEDAKPGSRKRGVSG